MVIQDSFKKYLSLNGIKFPVKSVQVVLELTAEGGTVPFIARYRKEKTGNLDEVAIRDILNCHENWEETVKRKEFILAEIEKQGNLTDILKARIEQSWDLAEIEELYRPYKRKKKTKATLAREAGLEPLASWLWELGQGDIQDTTAIEIKAKEFISPTKGFATYEEALRGAQHILVERLSNNIELRKKVRDEYFENSTIHSAKTTKFKKNSKYEMYGEYSEPIKNLKSEKASHRYLALRRGWQEGELKVSLQANDDQLLEFFTKEALKVNDSQAKGILEESAKHALSVHVVPSIANELHKTLKDNADLQAIKVFAENVRKVLMGSPFGSKVVLGVDPGIRTGCKLALLDKSGQFISSTVIKVTGENAPEEAKKLFGEVTKQITIEAVAVGNGTGGREAEKFLRETFKSLSLDIPVVMVNESGASVYSASDVAREEFPDLDITVRGAISIARRLQDPLAELVKIEPKSIGVGQYQHDVSQPKLKKTLHGVVESCVNQVGVDLNTASLSLLQYVAGIGPALAKNIVDFRSKNGLFKERDQLLEVPKFSSKGFEQAGGFLRIYDGNVALDATGIHPERYSAVKEMAQDCGTTVKGLMSDDGLSKLIEKKDKWVELIGEFTFNDIVQEFKKPGRDPRDPYKVFQFREDIHTVEDLKEGMMCPGIVTNVTNFGAFVDIGVHQDGLVHISELAHSFVDDPRKVCEPGDQVEVKVLGVDKDKNQISLSMLTKEKPQPKPKGERRSAKGKGKGPARNAAKGGKGRGAGKPKDRQRKGGGKGGKRPPGKPFNNPFAALNTINKD